MPSALLHAISTLEGRVALVVGAGCSLERPTGLELSRVYAAKAHEDLLADEVLVPGECGDPQDLSLLAEIVRDKTGSQADVVRRLPLRQFRLAKANHGYLTAAALLEEGALSCVITLNYDLAITDALRQLDATGVGVVGGPTSLDEFGTRAVIYLHRNVEEPDLERWILRRGALEREWRDSWEQVVVNRVAASPALVFAGLGSPAAVLTETIGRIRDVVGDGLQVYLADPSTDSPFASALGLEREAVIEATWGAFMDALAARVTRECCAALHASAEALCDANGWSMAATLDTALDAFREAGLLTIGRLRSVWLCKGNAYTADSSESRDSMAHLLLAMSELLGTEDNEIRLSGGGLVEITWDGWVRCRVSGLHGRGVLAKSAAEASLVGKLQDWEVWPDVVVTCGTSGPATTELSPPEDIVLGDADDDILHGSTRPRLVDFESIRGQGFTFRDLVTL